jgi:pimeloyl-ACP methyl ester carboxylesterase
MEDVPAAAGLRTVRSQDGTLIAYERAGSGPIVVVVDAAGCHRELGPSAALARILAPDLTTVIYDRRGRGMSTNTLPYEVAREVEDLAAVIRDVGEPVSLYGYSSGAVLALHAADRGLPISRLVLLEPPLDVTGEPPPVSSLEVEVARLVAAGRTGAAVEHFQRSIGVPDDLLRRQREASYWPAMKRLAPTLVYDLAISRSLPAERLRSVEVPTLVIASRGSSSELRAWARDVGRALPHGELHTLDGGWHGVPDAELARELREFLIR